MEVPEEPFGIPEFYWKAGLILFTLLLAGVTILLLIQGISPQGIGTLYAIPAILFAYFYRRSGVLVVFLLAMFFFSVVVVFRYPSGEEILAAALRSILLISIALIVAYLTHFLLLEKRKYHAIFDNTESGVAVLNLADHTLSDLNQRLISSLGHPEEAGDTLSLSGIVSDPGKVGALFECLSTHCSSPAIEVSMKRRDGTEWIAIIIGRKVSPTHAVLTFVDITERRKVDAELRQLHDDTNLYLDILTHDINNINTASLGFAQLIGSKAGPAQPDLEKKLVRTLGKSSEIIRNVSALRRLKEAPAQIIPVPLGEVIRKQMAGYPDTDIVYQGQDFLVQADDMLSSVFDNLIGNSIKFGGSAPHIEIRAVDAGAEVEVTIEDHGSGIPDALKEHVFERFQRGDTSVSGKGLGLFICRMLIERYGGRIRAGDRIPGSPDQGAAFRFTLRKA